MTSPPTLSDHDFLRTARLRMCVAMFGLLLVIATWPLWVADAGYPMIPWLGGLLSVPVGVDRMLAYGNGLSCLAISFCSARLWGQCRHGSPKSRNWERWLAIASTSWIACLAGSMLLDQQRLQVWAWELLWLAIFLTLATPRMALRCCRILVIGIYFYSALSKFDAGFVQTQGPWLWQGLQRAVGVEGAAWRSGPSLGMLVFPMGELLVAGLLAVPRTRRWGVAGSAAMHLTLLLALGPLGWNQLQGVLLWNLFFLVSVPLLFWGPREFSRSATESLGLTGAGPASPQLQGAKMSILRNALASLPPGDRLCLTIVVGLSVWPAFEGIGACDHWLAWAVYSSRPEVVAVRIREEEVAQLPADLQVHVSPAEALSSWRPFSLDQWSFATRRCPIYPQARYRLAVARHLEAAYGVTLRVSTQSTPDRWSGQRQTREVEDLAAECDPQFWFNTRSRPRLLPVPVSLGDRLIAHTAQLSVACYLIALLLAARPRDEARPTVGEACWWTAGLIALTVHIACAFHFLHHWSHSAALQHTAQRTAAVTGWDWPGGLYINYAFVLFWAVDAVRVWREALEQAPVVSQLRRRIVHGVFVFMMFNATVVFGPWHWTAVGVGFAIAWWGVRFAGCEARPHAPE